MKEKRVFKSMQEVLDAYLPNHRLCGRCEMPFLEKDMKKCVKCDKLFCNYCIRVHMTWITDIPMFTGRNYEN